jgi:hypothetical protein
VPLYKDPNRVEVYVLVAADEETVVRAQREYLSEVDFGLIFSGRSMLMRKAAMTILERCSLVGYCPNLVYELHPFQVDLQEGLPGNYLEDEMSTTEDAHQPQTLRSITTRCPRSLVLRGFFPQFLQRLAEAETARAVRGRVIRPILVVTGSPLAEMAWPEILFNDRLLKPGDLVKYTVEQLEERNCRRWVVLPAPDIFRLS